MKSHFSLLSDFFVFLFLSMNRPSWATECVIRWMGLARLLHAFFSLLRKVGCTLERAICYHLYTCIDTHTHTRIYTPLTSIRTSLPTGTCSICLTEWIDYCKKIRYRPQEDIGGYLWTWAKLFSRATQCVRGIFRICKNRRPSTSLQLQTNVQPGHDGEWYPLD